jgi:transcriptional regulator with XRE-family HTH domain
MRQLHSSHVTRQWSPPNDDEDIQARLGVVIRTRRRDLGLTQEELGFRAGLHRTYVADVERGARNLTLRSVVQLARALQIALGDLLAYATGPDTVGIRVAASKSPVAGEILLVEDNANDAEMTSRAFRRAKFANPLNVVRDARRRSTTFSARAAMPGRGRGDLSLSCSTSNCRACRGSNCCARSRRARRLATSRS